MKKKEIRKKETVEKEVQDRTKQEKKDIMKDKGSKKYLKIVIIIMIILAVFGTGTGIAFVIYNGFVEKTNKENVENEQENTDKDSSELGENNDDSLDNDELIVNNEEENNVEGNSDGTSSNSSGSNSSNSGNSSSGNNGNSSSGNSGNSGNSNNSSSNGSGTASSNIKTLLNSAPLNPTMTNYTELDNRISQIFSKIHTGGMSTYDKVKAAYDYLINNLYYGQSFGNLQEYVKYSSTLDEQNVSLALAALQNGRGVCDHYSAAFMVMLRRIGLDVHYVGGTMTNNSGQTMGHAWTIVKLQGKWYIFDPQVEDQVQSNGKINYWYFGIDDSTITKTYKYSNKNNYINSYGGFKTVAIKFEANINGIPLTSTNQYLGDIVKGSYKEIVYAVTNGYPWFNYKIEFYGEFSTGEESGSFGGPGSRKTTYEGFDGYTMSPSFSKDNHNYTATVTSLTDKVEIKTTPTNSKAKVSVSGNTNLKVGSNTITVTVEAEDGTKSTYTIIVTRPDLAVETEKSSDATLKSLNVSGYTLSPVFGKNTTNYEILVPKSILGLDVSAIANHDKATVSIQNNKGWTTGTNNIKIVVTAENGSTKTYIVTVKRPEDAATKTSSDNYLNNIKIAGIDLSFDKNVNSYNVTVPYEMDKLNLDLVLSDSKAKYQIIGNQDFKVTEKNVVEIEVTAEDGSIRIYTLNVMRSAVESKNKLDKLDVAGYPLSPTFDKDQENYKITVSSKTDKLDITAIAADPNSKVEIIGNSNLQTGVNNILVKVTDVNGFTKYYTIEVTKEGRTMILGMTLPIFFSFIGLGILLLILLIWLILMMKKKKKLLLHQL